MSVTPPSSSASIDAWEVLDLLANLAQKSLVVYEEGEQGRGRYRLLETVRQYARDRLLEAGEGEAVRGRHLALFLALAEQAEPMLQGPQQAKWLDRLGQELENLRAALEWSEGTRSGVENILRLVSATGSFWQLRFYRREGAHWLQHALQQAGGDPTVLRAKALYWAAVLYGQAGGSAEETRALVGESVATYRRLGNKRGLIRPLAWLAFCTQSDTAALALHEESVALAREAGDKHGLGYALWAMSYTLIDRADWGRLETVLQELLQLEQELGSPMGASCGRVGGGAGRCRCRRRSSTPCSKKGRPPVSEAATKACPLDTA